MSTPPSDVERAERHFTSALRRGWRYLLIEGIILASGLLGLVMTYMMRHAPGFWWSLLSAVLALAAGVVLIGWPVSGAVSLTLLLIVFFIMEGVASIMYALEHRR